MMSQRSNRSWGCARPGPCISQLSIDLGATHNREAVSAQSPGLPGFDGYPGNSMDTVFQPRRGCDGFFSSAFIFTALGLAQLRWGWIAYRSFPRVAAKARQPWALGRNRFAVKEFVRP